MNLRWLRQNLVVLIFSVAFVIALGTIILLERKAAAQRNQIVAELQMRETELQRLQAMNPTPASENIEALRRQREELQRLHEQLQAGALREPVKVPELRRDIEFSQLMRDTIARLNAAAMRRDVRLGENFAFGFSRYDRDFPCRQPGTKPEDCRKLLALLAKQLRVVEKLSQLLIESRVNEITKIRRTEVEPGTPGEDALPVPIGDDPKALYRTYPFELEFECGTDALRNFLNGLTKSDWFFAVRSLKIESAAVTSATALGEEVEQARVDQRLLKVTVRVDLVEFEPPASDAGRTAT